MVLKRAFVCLLTLALASGIAWAQKSPYMSHTTPSGKHVPPPPTNLRLIFSSLGPVSGDLYYDADGYDIAGPDNAIGISEQWIAIPFTPKVNAHVQELQAPIGWIAGTALVQLGLYSDNAGEVGTQLAVAESSNLPTFGTCCGLVDVYFSAVAVTAGTQYWIVGLSDDTNAPDFQGAWMSSNQDEIGYDVGQAGWGTFSGGVPGAAVRGTIP